MPGLPLFFCTRFNATMTLPRSTTRSIRRASSLPEHSFPWAAVNASPLRSALGASPLPSSGSSSCPDFRRVASSRFTGVSLSSPFGPSRRQRLPRVGGGPARLRGPLLRPLLTSRSAPLRRRPFGRDARPPQVRVVAFAARSPRLRRPPLVARPSRFHARSPWLAAPSTRFLFVDPQLLLLASFSLGLTACALRLARGSCDQAPQRTCTSWSRPCWAHMDQRRPPQGEAGAGATLYEV
jgi:hypothetical protein